MKALIDVILSRPGGFNGEIIIAEHVHRDPTEAMSGSYCWNMSTGNRLNNWPDLAYLGLVADYHSRGITIVTADPLYDSGQGTWATVTGPAAVAAGKQGWVHQNYTTAANSRTIQLAYPILRSPYRDKLIDLKNGVWAAGSYTGQKVKTIFLPTLNNHGSLNSEDYAGPTSALKCHLGIQDFNVAGGTNSLHGVGYNDPISPRAMGESVGQLITTLIKPAFYLTCAEYTGYRGRTEIYEVLSISESIEPLITSRTSTHIIKQKAIAEGMRTLREDGWTKVLDGITTVKEVLRVTEETIEG